MASNITKDFDRKSALRRLTEAEKEQATRPLTGNTERAANRLYGRDAQIEQAVNRAERVPETNSERAEEQESRKAPADFRFADGGSIAQDLVLRNQGLLGNAARALSGRGRQIDSIVDNASNGMSAPQPAPTPAPAPQQPQTSALRQDTTQQLGLDLNTNASQRASDAVSAARDLFNPDGSLRFADGGRVKGKGGRTDDKVGPVMLSDEEYVLPADTADAIGRDKLDALRLQTHDFKDGDKESALRAYLGGDHLADGGTPFFDKAKQGVQNAASGLANAARTAGAKVMDARAQMNDYLDQRARDNRAAARMQASNPVTGVQSGPAPQPGASAMRTPGGPAIQNIEPANPMNGAASRINPGPAPTATPAVPRTERAITGGGNGAAALAEQRAASEALRAQHQAGLDKALAGGTPTQPGRLGRVARGVGGFAATGAVLGGIGDSIGQQTDSAYMREYADRLGNNGAGIGTRALNVLDNIGNAATGGYAGRLGRGISSLASGGSFSEGWNAPTTEESIRSALRTDPAPVAAPQAVSEPAAPVAAASVSTPAAQPAAPAVTTRQTTPAGWTQVLPGVYRQGNTYADLPGVQAVGVNRAVGAGSRDAKRMVDEIRKGYQDFLGSQSSDWKARHGASVLRDMYGEMDRALGSRVAAGNADIQANTAALGLENSNQIQRAQQALTRQHQNDQLGQNAAASALRLAELQDKRDERAYARAKDARDFAASQAQLATQNQQAGMKAVDDAIQAITVGPDGKPSFERAAGLRRMLNSGDFQFNGKAFKDLNPQEQREAVAYAMPSFEMMERQNAVQSQRSDKRSPIVARTGSMNLGDVFGGNASLGQYLLSKSPLGRHDVLRDASGRAFLASDLMYNADGSENLDRQRLIGEDLKRHSALR